MSAGRGTLTPDLAHETTRRTALTGNPGEAEVAAPEAVREILDHSPRGACLQAFPADLPGMVPAALPALLVLGATLLQWFPDGLGLVSGTLAWMGLSASGWWMAFRSVERTLDRLQDLGWGGLPGRRLEALVETLPVGFVYLTGMFGVYAALLLLATVNGAKDPVEYGIFVGLLLGPPVLLVSPWVATYALLRRRFHGHNPIQVVGEAALALASAPVRIAGDIFGAYRDDPLRPADRALDWLYLVAPVIHMVVAGVLGYGTVLFLLETRLMTKGVLALVLPLGIAALHLQHELAVFTESYALRESLRQELAPEESSPEASA